MSRSSALYHLQQLDTGLDNARKRIQEIVIQLKDRSTVEKASEIHRSLCEIHDQKTQVLKEAEQEVSLQHTKLDQNQKKLYSGGVTNPKELEDLQLEANSLTKYLQVLEDRQLKAMLEADQTRADLDEVDVYNSGSSAHTSLSMGRLANLLGIRGPHLCIDASYH